MNKLKSYLVEVIKIEPCNDEWAKDEYIWITAIFKCCGIKETYRKLCSKADWRGIVERGHYLL